MSAVILRGDARQLPPPCQCHRSFAYLEPAHDGHCCFLPATQDCHPAEVAEWERRRDERMGLDL